MTIDAATQARLVGLFVAEAEEALAALGAAHRRLAEGASPGALEEFGRTAHGLKGAAAALGFAPLAGVLHDLEEVSLGLDGADGEARRERHGRLEAALELLDQGISHMAAAGLPAFPEPLAASIAAALAEPGAPLRPARDEATGAELPATEAPARGAAPAGATAPEAAVERLSVPAAEVDEALRLAASLARAALQLHEQLLAGAGAPGGASQGVALRAERLEAVIAGLRLLPADEALSGIEEEVAALARRLDRRVVLAVEGREVRADRRTLQAARGMIRHLVRNALDHGLEPPAARRAAGKLPVGRLSLRLAGAEGALRVTVRDDGAGFDVAAARQALVRRGGDPARVAALPEPEVLARFAAQGGSTRGEVTDVSGRGLGLSAVAALARDAGGSLAIETRRGEGSAVTFTLPLDVYSVEVLVATAGGHAVGLPVQRLEQTVLLEGAGEAVQAGPAGRTLAVGEGIVPLVDLAGLLGGAAQAEERFALVVHGADGSVALAVEEIGEVVAVVPAAVPGVAGRGELVTGLARLADGTAVEVLDPRVLLAAAREAVRRPQAARPAPPPAAIAGAEPAARPAPERRERALEVVLAEDSLATREVLRVLLEEQGFRVRLAADGEEALARLRERVPDVLVSDLNMPRRDGLALTRALRADPATARLPVVLLTSQDDEATRAAGAAAGADAYLVKSRFNADVLAATLARIGLDPSR